MTPTKTRLRIGTRESALARLQTDMVVAALKSVSPDLQIEIVARKTSGDRVLDRPIAALGSMGVFVKELEDLLLQKEVDLVVHSLKDLPTGVPEGLSLAAVLRRDDPRDAYLSVSGKPFSEAPPGSRIATSSRRRAAQLGVLRPDVEFVDVRGNLPTRLRKLEEGECDGMVLAAAGLIRLGLQARITEFFEPDISVPAAGQGSLAVECRSDDQMVSRLLGLINDERVAIETKAERAFLRHLGGGCSAPIGVLGRVSDAGSITLIGCVADGKQLVKDTITGSSKDGESLAVTLAERLLKGGADKILNRAPHNPQPISPP